VQGTLLALLLAAVFAVIPAAFACGYCVEDKIASVYDHAAVAKALGEKHHTVYFHVDGPLGKDERTKKAIEAAAASSAGVDRASVHVNVETLTLALAFDPKRVRLVSLQSELEKKLARQKLTLMPLRTIEAPGDLAALHSR